MSGKAGRSGNTSGRTAAKTRKATVEPRSPQAKAMRGIRNHHPLTEVPPMPNDIGIGAAEKRRSKQIWKELWTLGIKHGLLTEADLPAMRWTVIQWRQTEGVTRNANKATPANCAKMINTLEKLGFAPSGRHPTAAVAETKPPLQSAMEELMRTKSRQSNETQH